MEMTDQYVHTLKSRCASGVAKSSRHDGLFLFSLDDGPLLPLEGRNPQKNEVSDVYASLADRRCLRRVETPKMESPGFVEPLWPTVVASGESEPSKFEGLRFVKPPWRTVVASSGPKFPQIEGLGLLRSL